MSDYIQEKIDELLGERPKRCRGCCGRARWDFQAERLRALLTYEGDALEPVVAVIDKGGNYFTHTAEYDEALAQSNARVSVIESSLKHERYWSRKAENEKAALIEEMKKAITDRVGAGIMWDILLKYENE